MAVVQISKIQVRRGQKSLTGTIPQLSSAEFAWAVDSQELFIGNGSVTEGAPYVGNTKILTEHDNILELASSYKFGGANPAVLYSIPRSLQNKLDEYVSIVDFGGVGDGSSDNVTAFREAFDDLYQNSSPEFRKVLFVPNGEYYFATDLKIPSGAIIRGETKDRVIFKIGASNIQFISEDGSEYTDVGFNSSNRPYDVSISNLTISRTSGSVVLTSLYNSVFDQVNVSGTYDLGDVVSVNETPAIYWENNDSGLAVTGIDFNNCRFENIARTIECVQTQVFETKVNFNNCYFVTNDLSVYIQGTDEYLGIKQSNNWKFINTTFEDIVQQAFVSTYGIDTLFDSCGFLNCGSGGLNNPANPQGEVVLFNDSKNNRLVNCNTNRTQAVSNIVNGSTTGYPEAVNASLATFNDRVETSIIQSNNKVVGVFSTRNRYIYINYVIRMSVHVRVGKLTISIDEDFESAAITDEYQYSSETTTHPGGTMMTEFEFLVSLADNDEDSGIDTLVLSYRNRNGTDGTLSYNISYGV